MGRQNYLAGMLLCVLDLRKFTGVEDRLVHASLKGDKHDDETRIHSLSPPSAHVSRRIRHQTVTYRDYLVDRRVNIA